MHLYITTVWYQNISIVSSTNQDPRHTTKSFQNFDFLYLTLMTRGNNENIYFVIQDFHFHQYHSIM